jgi:hypothetical protein
MTTRINDFKAWMKIPNGTKVRLTVGGMNGVIDGVTELVVGPGRNPDGRTQYRVNVGDPLRMLCCTTRLTRSHGCGWSGAHAQRKPRVSPVRDRAVAAGNVNGSLHGWRINHESLENNI